jgi:hypothetical protein
MSLWPWCGPMSCGQCVREGSARVFNLLASFPLPIPSPNSLLLSNDNVAAISTRFRAICHWVDSRAGCRTRCTLPRRGSGNFPKAGSFNHDRESAACTRALPEKERIAPNQKSWPETAERMGVKRAPKRKRLPEERGITEKSIGVAKGKRRRIHQDPYAGGERSGKNAKPDALSAMANARACTNAAPSAIVPFPPSQVPQRRVPSSSLTSSPVTHVPTSLPI